MKKINKVLLAILSVAMIYSFGCNKSTKSIDDKTKPDSTTKSGSQVTDKDGNVYKTVKIGTQEWTSENLNVEHYRNGDVIPQVQDADKWSNLTTGAWSYYDNETSNGKIYGKLYNWYAVVDPRGLATKGWHVPSDAEWTELTDYFGGDEVAGGKLKARTLWNSPNTGATNESVFTAFPGGYRYLFGDYYQVGKQGCFWSASKSDYINFAWYRSLYYDYSIVNHNVHYKRDGLSIRCIRD